MQLKWHFAVEYKKPTKMQRTAAVKQKAAGCRTSWTPSSRQHHSYGGSTRHQNSAFLSDVHSVSVWFKMRPNMISLYHIKALKYWVSLRFLTIHIPAMRKWILRFWGVQSVIGPPPFSSGWVAEARLRFTPLRHTLARLCGWSPRAGQRTHSVRLHGSSD